MKVINKNHKKIDCILFYDELEMLNFRLNQLNDHVDYFIILECDIDFQGNKKKLFFQENKELFSKWESKIIHIPTTNISKNYIDSISEITKIKELTPYKNSELTSDEIIYCQTYNLYKILISLKLYPEDIILFSAVDEIPDLTQFDTIIKNLNFEPVVLKQKNFVWTTEYYDPTPYMGTCCFQYTSLIDFPNKIFQKYSSKKNRLNNDGTKCENGFHFSHFYSLEKTIQKLQLISDEENLREKITNCFKNLISIQDYGYENPQSLIEYNGELPKYHSLLPSQKIGRDYSKKYTITLNYDKVESIFSLNIHYDKNDYFDILLPTSKYYDVLIEENTLENFQKMYGANEIKKIIRSFYPLNQDLFKFVNDGKFIEYSWAEIKNEFIYDRIKDIL
jgi:beta-1,4-mannosyl-glycoprotein beta-1,4-N-acetylglucosaminyltransferase